MRSPIVSILIPVYNRRQYIAECVESALNQTFPNIEVVIVDNASTDGSWEICEQYAASDGRVRLLRNSANIGPVRNWIRCAQEARGEYSKILFSDDLLEPNCVERMAAPLENSDVGLVYCAARVGESVENSVRLYSLDGRPSFASREYLEMLLSGRAPVSPGAIMLRTKDLVENLRDTIPTGTPRPFDRHGAGPDVMISLLTISSYPRVAHVADPLVFFRNHPESFTVLNTGNEVRSGYLSTFAYYLRNYVGWLAWSRYLASEWLSDVWRAKEWANPITFLRAYEGKGSLGELLGCGVFAGWIVVKKILTRLTGSSKSNR